MNKHLNQQAKSAQRAAIGTQLASTALSGLMSFGVSAAFSLVSSGISYLIHYKEEAVKAARESAEAFSSSVSSLEGQKDKIKELRTALESGSLSESEALAVKTQLVDIQQQLIATYGDQARGIDLVNGSLEHQLNLVGQLSKEDASKFLHENRFGIDETKEKMENTNYYLGDIGGDDPDASTLRNIAERYKEQGLQIQDYYDGSATIHFVGDASQADETIHRFMSDLEQEMGNSDLARTILDDSAFAIKENNEVLNENLNTYKQILTAEMITAGSGSGTAADIFNQYTTAIQNYNDALLSGNADAIQAAEKAYHDLDNDLRTDSKDLIAPYQFLFDDAAKQLNTAAVNSQNFIDILHGKTPASLTGSKSGDLLQFDGLKDQVDAIKGMTSKDFWAGVSNSGTGSVFQDVINQAKEAGLVAEGSVEDYQRLLGMLIEAGVLTDSTNSTMSEKAKEVRENSEAALSSISLVNQAMQEQDQNGYISLDTQQKLLASNSAYAACLTQTASGLQLNVQAAKELADQQAKDNLADIQKNREAAIAQYEKNREEMEGMAQGAENLEKILSGTSKDLSNGELFSLAAANDSLALQIDHWSELENQILLSTSALQEYKDAQSSPDAKDNYDTVVSGMKRADELYKQGWKGQDDFVSYAKLIAKDGASDEEAVKYYEENKKRLSKYLTGDSSGVEAWLEDAKALGGDFITEENGVLHFSMENLDQFANDMDMSTELVRYFIAALQDTGTAADITSLSDDFRNLDVNAENSTNTLTTLIEHFGALANAGHSPSEYLPSIMESLQNFQDSGIDISDQIDQLNELGKAHGFSIDEKDLKVHYTADTSEVDSTTEQVTQGEEKTLTYETDTSGVDKTDQEATEPVAKTIVEHVKQTVTTVVESQGGETGAPFQATGIVNYTLGTYPTSVPDVSGKINYTVGVKPKYLPTITATVNYRLGFVQEPSGAITRY